MKRLLLFLILPLAMLPVVVVSACGGEGLQKVPAYNSRFSGNCSPNEPTDIAFPLSEEEGEAEVYRLDIPERDLADVADIARKFGVMSDPVPVENAEGLYSAEDEKAEVLVLEYGGFGYSRKSPGDGKAVGEPVPETEAKDVAQRFLRDHDLLPKVELEMITSVVQSTARVRVVFSAATIHLPNFPDWQVISVEVGPDSQVWDMNYMWQEPRAIGKYPIISEIEALERLHACKAYVYGHGQNSGVLEFTEGDLAYVGLTQGSPENGPPYELLVPAWVFRGEPMQVEGWERPQEFAWIPAVADEYLETP